MQVRTKADKVKKIKERLQELEKKQNTFALDCDVEPSTVSKFCTGKHPLSLPMYQKLAAALGFVWQEIGEIVTDNSSDNAAEEFSTLPPHNLHPPTNSVFFGRDLTQLHDALKANPPIVVVHGLPGVGKSLLAWRYAWEYLEEYSGGVCWVNRQDGNLAVQVVREAEATGFLDAPPPKDDDPVSRVRHCWRHWCGKNTPVLLILDDVQDHTQLAELLRALPSRFHILITMRQAPNPGVRQLRLEVLRSEEAKKLFLSFLPEQDERRKEIKDVETLCQLLDHLPLALCLVGSYLQWEQDISLRELHQRLQKNIMLDEALLMTGFGVAERSLCAAFDLTWQLLGEQEQRLGCLLSLLAAGTFSWDLVERAIDKGVPVTSANAARGVLQKLHLLERVRHREYKMHSLTRQYFRYRLSSLTETQILLQQGLYRSLMESTPVLPERPFRQQVEEAAVTVPHLEEAVRSFKEVISTRDLFTAVTTIQRYYQGQCLYGDALSALQETLSDVEQAFGTDSPEIAELYRATGGLHYFQRQFKPAAAWFLKALASAEATGDELLIARVLQAQAALWRDNAKDVEDLAQAKTAAERAFAIQEQRLGQTHPDTADSLMTLALIHLYAQQYDEAESLLLKVLEVRENLGDPNNPDIGESCNGLGVLYERQGKDGQAREYHIKALRFRRRVHGKEHPQTAESHNNLGKVYASRQETFAKAKRHYERAIAIFGDPMHQKDQVFECGWCLKNLGELYVAWRKNEEARKVLKKACGVDDLRTQECYQILRNLVEV